ncbi:MAG: M24 family metallopeptidase [Acidimicrobiia bacterium]
MSAYADRLARARAQMAVAGVDALLLSVGADLPYLTGYEAMPLERVTMLVVPRDGGATLVVPRLEAPRVVEQPHVFTVMPWDETDDPLTRVAELVGTGAAAVGIGERTWARFVLGLQDALPGTRFRPATDVMAPLRMHKDAAEIECLEAAAHAVDRVAAEMRERPFAGRTEADVHRELADRLLEHGHQRVNFAIVGSGPNGASPHHEASERVIGEGDVIVCDFGGTMHGYCSDITRVFVVGEPTPEVRDVYAVLSEAQERAVRAATTATTCEAVDAAAREVIDAAGYGGYFVHRTGHGIGLEEHEEPYIVAGNERPIEAGFAFSVEPGIYFPGRFGLRLEDIVVATDTGPRRLNVASRELAVVA